MTAPDPTISHHAVNAVWTDKQIDAGARALRERDMAGRITREWSDIPASEKRKWIARALTVLNAAHEVKP